MNELCKLNCVILCGGKSSRMGQDKSLLKLGSHTLTHLAFIRFSPLFKKVYISAKEDKFAKEFNLIKDDENYDFHSSLLALYSVLKNFKDEFVFITCVDYPKLSKKEILKMATLLNSNHQAIIAKTPLKTHFLCGFFHSSLSSLCKKHLDQKDFKIANLFSKINHTSCDFEEENFVNLNFYEDFLKLKE